MPDQRKRQPRFIVLLLVLLASTGGFVFARASRDEGPNVQQSVPSAEGSNGTAAIFDPEDGGPSIGFYPDEELRQSEPGCDVITTNPLGLATSFACLLAYRVPGDDMDDVADRMPPDSVSDSVIAEVRGWFPPDSWDGAGHEIETELEQAYPDDIHTRLGWTAQIDVRAVYLRYEAGGQPSRGPDSQRYFLDVKVWVTIADNGQATVTDFEASPVGD